jgi:hypothetical protein
MTAKPQSIYSPVDGRDYALIEDGFAEVTDRATGRCGVFTLSGKFISGELRSCDLNMLMILRPRTAIPFVALKQG